MKFTYMAYEDLMVRIHAAGYTFCDYHNYESYTHPCILRHDVDFDMEKATMFAEMEADISERLGVSLSSTYFVLLKTDFYNLYTKNNRMRIARIIASGQHIGLHFDEKQYVIVNNPRELATTVEEELFDLSRIVGEKVTAVSVHRPSRVFLEADLTFSEAINSYGQKFFRDLKYISDSRMQWHEDIDRIVQEKTHKALHILSHPIWYKETQESAGKILTEFLYERNNELEAALNENIRDLSSMMRDESSETIREEYQ